MKRLRLWLWRGLIGAAVAGALAWPASLVVSVWVQWGVMSVAVQDNVLVIRYSELKWLPASAKCTELAVARVFSPTAWARSLGEPPEFYWRRATAKGGKTLRASAQYRYAMASVPLALVSLAALIGLGAGAAGRRIARRRALEACRCAECGYSLAGLPAGPCPECGSTAPGPA